MISLPAGSRVWLATDHTDMRKGFDGLALLVQETLKRNPHTGHLFVFRGRRGSLIKRLWHDGQGMCLFAKRLEQRRTLPAMTDREAFAEPSGQRFSEMAPKKKVSCIAPASHCRGEPPAA